MFSSISTVVDTTFGLFDSIYLGLASAKTTSAANDVRLPEPFSERKYVSISREAATVEKVDTLQQRVDELEKGIEIDKQILEDQIVAPKGSVRLPNKGNGNEAKRWSNHKWDFGKCEIGSDEFDKALEEGYEFFTQADRLAYMRKPKHDLT